jgi:type II secretory pathway pseudopilin PulG
VVIALVVALVLGGWLYVSRQQLQTQAAQAERETQVLTAQDAKLDTRTVNGALVSITVSKQRNQVLVVANNLPEPGAGLIYRLWVKKGPNSAFAGEVRGGDVREVFTVSQLAGADRLVLTSEPASGGTGKSTGPELAQVDL